MKDRFSTTDKVSSIFERKAYAQGDVLLLSVPIVDPSRGRIPVTTDGPVILAEGEHTGHRHAFYGGAVMFRDDAMAHGMPADLYIGHVKIAASGAVLEHGPGPGQRGDHDPVKVPGGTYVALRQREYAGRELGAHQAFRRVRD